MLEERKECNCIPRQHMHGLEGLQGLWPCRSPSLARVPFICFVALLRTTKAQRNCNSPAVKIWLKIKEERLFSLQPG